MKVKMSKQPKNADEKIEVSVVIPNYNGADLIAENLPLVLKAKANRKNLIVEIVVVDDCSKDESVRLIKKFFKEVKLVKHKKNRGFSAAVNTGVRSATGNYIVLLNNDVYPDSQFLEKVLPLFEDENLFAVSFHEKGWGRSRGVFENGFVELKPGRRGKKPKPTFFVNAGGAIYRRSVWKELGGMDEVVYSPFYWEDVDISYRAAKRGYKLLWSPHAVVSPNLSATVAKFPKKKVSRIQERNQLLFIWKNITSWHLTRKHIKALVKRVTRHPGYVVIVIMALLKLFDVAKLRRKENKECKISDEAIFARF
jgi:GT2 family glycosyltransferase